MMSPVHVGNSCSMQFVDMRRLSTDHRVSTGGT